MAILYIHTYIQFINTAGLTLQLQANVISATLAQPSFLTYMNLLNTDMTALSTSGLSLISATNGIFQTGGVIGTVSQTSSLIHHLAGTDC